MSLSTVRPPPEQPPFPCAPSLPQAHLQLCLGSAGLLGLPGRRLQHEYLPVSRRRVFFSVMLCWQDGSLQSCCSSASTGAASGVALHPMLAGRVVSQDAVAHLKQRFFLTTFYIILYKLTTFQSPIFLSCIPLSAIWL